MTEQRSSAERFEAVYRAEGSRLWLSVLAAFGSRDIADDSVAEAFAQALRRGSEIRDPRAWVWRAAFRIARGQADRQMQPPAPPGVAFDAETDWALLEALRTLSDLQRQSVVLRHMGGWSAIEIAELTGSTAGSVRVQITKALHNLRRELGANDDH